MSDLDDWENDLDDQLEEKVEEKPSAKKFVEEEVDSDDENKKKADAKKAAIEAAKNAPKKEKVIPMTEQERRALKRAEKEKAEQKAAGGKTMTEKEKIQAEETKATENEVDNIFGGADVELEKPSLKTRASYIKFAKQMSEILYSGESPYNIPFFFQELLKELPTKS